MSNLTATQAKRRGFLLARIDADKAEIQLIDASAEKTLQRLQAQEAEAREKLAERTARLSARRG